MGIIGHTGSGKSTLIQHLNGLVKATDGAYIIMEKTFSKMGMICVHFVIRSDWFFSIRSISCSRSDVLTDVCFGPKNQGLSKEECEKRAIEALKLVGLRKNIIVVSI